MTTSASNSVWDRHAQQWNRVGYPLRPSARDGELMMELVKPALDQNGDPARVAILGVTQEVVALPWPAGIKLMAFDQNAEMIAKDVSYNFPTLAAFQSTIAPWFDFDHIAYVDADVARRCPTMRLRIAPRWK